MHVLIGPLGLLKHMVVAYDVLLEKVARVTSRSVGDAILEAATRPDSIECS